MLDTLPLMLDGKDDTFFYCRKIQQAGDWFGLDLGGVHEVRRILLVQGRNDGDHDRVHTGVLETSVDGKRWQPVPDISLFQAVTDLTLDPPRRARQVRVRVTKAGKADGSKNDVWTAIRQFEINPLEGASLRTDLPAFAALPVRASEGVISISPMLEAHPFPPGKYLGLLLPEAAAATQLEVDLKTADAAGAFVLEATADGRGWNPLVKKTAGTLLTAKLDGKVVAVRVRNAGTATPAVTLAKFALSATVSVSGDPLAAITDGRLDTSVEFKPGGSAVIRPPASEKPVAVTLLMAPSHPGSAKLTAIIGGQKRLLGSVKGAYVRFPLPPGTTGIVLSASGDSAALTIHEVLWSSR
jgi:hypothetical protein